MASARWTISRRGKHEGWGDDLPPCRRVYWIVNVTSRSCPITKRITLDRHLVLFLVAASVALQPLLQGRIAWRADGLLHFYRLAQLDRALRGGLLYPRWLPDMGFGFGFPLFNYYAPLGYYLVEPLRLAGFSVGAALMSSFGLALLVGGLGVYLWVRDLFGRAAGLIAALAAVYAPYTLYNVFHRGALAELWGLAWLPLVLWALHRLARYSYPRDLILVALTYAALILSHNISALIASPLLAGYGLFLCLFQGSPASADGRRRVILLVGGLALGLGLSAFFWGPAFFEKNLVQIQQLYAPADLDYRNNFVTLGDLLAAPNPADPAMVNPPTPRSLGWPQLFLALVALLTARRWPGREARAHLFLLTLVTLGLVLMTLPLSRPLWERLPLLRFVQFPWRFTGPAELTLAALAGAGAAQLVSSRPALSRLFKKAHGESLWLGIVALALLLFALFWLFPARYPLPSNPSPVDMIRFEAESGALGTTSAGDYLPVSVTQLPASDALLPAYQAAAPGYLVSRIDLAALPEGATLVRADYGLNRAELTLDTPVGFRARFNWYYFPGWQGKLDDAPLELQPDGPHGLVSADVPPGQHQLVVTFGDTLLRRRATAISLLSLIVLIASVSLVRVEKISKSVARRPLSGWGTLAFVLATLAFFALKSLYLDHHASPFNRARWDGERINGVQVPLQVNFGNELALLGYDLPSTEVRADGVLALTLYWRALRPLESNYSVAVHLVDDRDWRYAQQDKPHPADYPTTRWQVSEYARDVYRLAVWPATLPGTYKVLVSVYDLQTGRRLDHFDANGAPAGTLHTLTSIQVTRSSRPPDLADLGMKRTLNAGLGGGLTLLGLDIPSPVRANAGERLVFTLHWQAETAPAADYAVRLQLTDGDGAVVVEERAVPGRTEHPTSAWRAGDVVRGGYRLLIPAATPDGDYSLHLSLVDASGRPQGAVVNLGVVNVRAPQRTFDPPSPQYSLAPAPPQLGQLATLLGYDLSAEILQPGQTLDLTLYWQARGTAEARLTVFVHLLGADGYIYAQRDRAPADGARPTTGWIAGEIIRDAHTLTLAEDAPPGGYRLQVGLYAPRSGDRLSLLDADGTGIDTRILLPTVIQVE